jgi:hypothetical protein
MIDVRKEGKVHVSPTGRQECRETKSNERRALMHIAATKRPIGLDRLATSSEVRSAILLASLSESEADDQREETQEMESELQCTAGNVSDDDVWLALASQILDPMSN